jgi:hypothetical protein
MRSESEKQRLMVRLSLSRKGLALWIRMAMTASEKGVA